MKSDDGSYDSMPSIFGRIARAGCSTPILEPLIVNARFKKIWDGYPEPYKAIIDQASRQRAISVVTDEADIPVNVQIAGHLDGNFYFRWRRIAVEHLDVIIIHEIAHYYIDARDGRKWLDYQIRHHQDRPERTLEVKALLSKVEAEAIAIETEVRTKMGLADQFTEQQFRAIIEGAEQTLLIVTFAANRLSGFLDPIIAAARRQVKISVVLELESESYEQLSAEELMAIRELPSEVVVSRWPSPKRGVNADGHLGKLHFKCAASDRAKAYVVLANSASHQSKGDSGPGVLLTGADAASLHGHFDSLVSKREFERYEPKNYPSGIID